MKNRLVRTAVATTAASAVLLGACPALAAPGPVVEQVQERRASVSTTRQSKPTVVRGTVPKAYGNKLVVLEVVDSGTRQQVGMGIADPKGAIEIPVVLSGGSHQAQWRVLHNNKVAWTSKPFPVNVASMNKPSSVDSRAAWVRGHQHPRHTATSRKPKVKAGRAGTENESGSALTTSGPVSGDATGKAVADAVKNPVQMVGDFGKTLVSNIGWDFVGDGVGVLFGLIFPGNSAATGAQVQQLTTDVNTGFATVEQELANVQAQLNAIQDNLQSLQAQVLTVQTEVVQANASAAAGVCTTQIDQADDYVQSIQNVYAEYQEVIDPQWVQQNLDGLTPIGGLTAVGNQMFGAGSGVPSFAGGVTQLQTNVTNLAQLLQTDGGLGSASLIGACASAVSAGVAQAYAGAQGAAGVTQADSIVPAGAVEQAYYQQMHSLVAYFTSWLAMGQQLAGRGSQMGAALLTTPPVTTLAGINSLCQNAVPGAGSVLTCGGLLANLNATLRAVQASWLMTGASWYDITGGLLVGDAKAGDDNGYLIPSQNAWVQDIAQFGASSIQDGLNPVGQTSAGSGQSASYVPAGPLSSVYQPGEGGPVTAVGVPVPSSMPASWAPAQANGLGANGSFGSTWIGLPFTAAATSQWQSLIPYGSIPASTSSASAPVGSLIYQAGLTNAGSTPTGLLLYTTEYGQFNAQTVMPAPYWVPGFSPGCGSNQWVNGGYQDTNCITWDISGPSGQAQSTIEKSYPAALGAASFIDTNVSIAPGTSPVVQAPSNVVTGSDPLTMLDVVDPADQPQGVAQQFFSCTEADGSKSGWVWLYPCGVDNTYDTYVSTTSQMAGVNPTASAILSELGYTQNTSFYDLYEMDVTMNFTAASWTSPNGSVWVNSFDGTHAAYNSTMFSLVSNGTTSYPDAALGSPTRQYVWPVVNLTSTTPPCVFTDFTEGYDGNAGVGDVCANLYQDWMAGVLGVDTGAVSVTAGAAQGTLTAAGDNVLQVMVTNSSATAQQVTLSAGAFNGNGSVGTALSATPSGANGVAIGTCRTAQNALDCPLTVQPGTTLLQLPLVVSAGDIGLAVSGKGIASASVTRFRRPRPVCPRCRRPLPTWRLPRRQAATSRSRSPGRSRSRSTR